MKKLALLFSVMLILSSVTACQDIRPVDNPVTAESTEETASSETTYTQITETELSLAETIAVTTQTQAPVTTAVPQTTAATTVTTTVPVTMAPVTTTPAPVTTVPQPAVNPSSYKSLNYSEQKAIWISYLEFQRILKGKSQEQFTASVREMYDKCKSMGINTVYVHARSHSDAFYKSDIYPWSSNCTGTIGADPGFDPFEILVSEAHSRGLSIHAWINPLRGVKTSELQAVSDKFLMKQWYNNSNTRGKYIVEVGGIWYCSPAYKEVRDMITNGVKEIVSKYNVDGIHIDDYFYPTTDTSFDKAAFQASGSNNLTQWRLDTVSSMVKELYSGIKSVNPNVLFGVSPQGNINNNYQTQYADVRKWASSSGYIDYLVPQIYFGFKNKTQPYETNLQSWCDMVTNPNIKLVVGLAQYKIGSTESTGEWKNDSRILARQTESFRTKSKYGGVAFFRYDTMFIPSSAVANQIKQENAELEAILK